MRSIGRSVALIALFLPLTSLGCRDRGRPVPQVPRPQAQLPARVRPVESWADIEPPFVSGDTTSPCPRIALGQYPALLFAEPAGTQEHLRVAWFGDGRVHREEILSASAIEVYPLDDAVLLVRTPAANQADNVYVADLRAGVVKLLGRRRLDLLRTVPERQKAMLVSYSAGFEKMALLELDLVSHELRLHSRLAGHLLSGGMPGLGFDVRVSPDFKRIACTALTKQSHPGSYRSVPFVLRSLDLSTMRVTDLDKHVLSENSSLSSMGVQGAPLEWLDNRRVLYQHVPLGRGDEAGRRPTALHILKVVDLDTGEVSDCVRASLPLSSDGGSLRANPFNGEIIYRNEWVVDVNAGRLRAKDEGIAVRGEYARDSKIVIHGERGVGDWPLSGAHTWVSASRRHWARAVAPAGAKGVVLYAWLDGQDRRIPVVESTDRRTRPIAWIEDTRPLRARKKE